MDRLKIQTQFIEITRSEGFDADVGPLDQSLENLQPFWILKIERDAPFGGVEVPPVEALFRFGIVVEERTDVTHRVSAGRLDLPVRATATRAAHVFEPPAAADPWNMYLKLYEPPKFAEHEDSVELI